jgi:hypothetical protein
MLNCLFRAKNIIFMRPPKAKRKAQKGQTTKDKNILLTVYYNFSILKSKKYYLF